MPYTHTTLASAKTQLAALLNDPSKVHWKDAELGVYIQEAMRTWGALTAYWRVRGTFATTAGTAFYDLATSLPALLGYAVTDTAIVQAIEYHLLETATVPWTGTDHFNLTEVTAALQRRRNQFLFDSGVVLTRTVMNVPPPPIGRVVLPDNVIDVRRAVWQPVTGPWSNVWRVDEWQLTAFQQNWMLNPGTPGAYSILEVPPLQIQLGPPPLAGGWLDLVTVNTGTVLNPVAGVVLGVPDDWAWVVKWGAISDLLSKDGPTRDPLRSEYAEARYRQGVDLAQKAACVLFVELNGVPCFPDSLANLDAANPGWQGKTRRAPSDVSLAGDLLAVCPVPDKAYSVTLDLVQKCPVPVADADFLELGREQLSTVLGYAQHLAAFKSGGAEFLASVADYRDFLIQAGEYNEHIEAAGPFAMSAAEQSQKEEKARPRRKAGMGLGALRKTA